MSCFNCLTGFFRSVDKSTKNEKESNTGLVKLFIAVTFSLEQGYIQPWPRVLAQQTGTGLQKLHVLVNHTVQLTFDITINYKLQIT